MSEKAAVIFGLSPAMETKMASCWKEKRKKKKVKLLPRIGEPNRKSFPYEQRMYIYLVKQCFVVWQICHLICPHLCANGPAALTRACVEVKVK